MAEPKTAKKPTAEVSGPRAVSRREFLMYAWGASLGLLAAGSGVASYAFGLPRFKAGEFGGAFTLGPASALPAVNAAPVANTTGKFWLVHTEEGVKALYKVCTHLGCLYEWDTLNYRFQCPCHGSRFWLDGSLMRGPAARGLDQFVVRAVDGSGNVVAETTKPGEAVAVSDSNLIIVVDTGKRLSRPGAVPVPAGEQQAPAPGAPPIKQS